MNILKCKICDDEFIPKHPKQIYCCRKCKKEADKHTVSKKPKTKICQFCENEFRPYTSLDKFCSAKCRINNVKSKRTRNWSNEKANAIRNENNPAYRNGNYCLGAKKTAVGERKFIANGKKIRQEMIDDKGYIYCQHCGKSNQSKYECHHVIFRSEKPLHKNLHNIKNLILLCVKCHNEFHRNKPIRNSIVEQRNLHELFGNDVLNKQTKLKSKESHANYPERSS